MIRKNVIALMNISLKKMNVLVVQLHYQAVNHALKMVHYVMNVYQDISFNKENALYVHQP